MWFRSTGETAVIRPDAWELLLAAAVLESGREVPWNRERVVFPYVYIISVSERRLDWTRTAVLAGTLTVGAVLLGRSFLSGYVGNDEGGGQSGPPL